MPSPFGGAALERSRRNHLIKDGFEIPKGQRSIRGLVDGDLPGVVVVSS